MLRLAGGEELIALFLRTLREGTPLEREQVCKVIHLLSESNDPARQEALCRVDIISALLDYIKSPMQERSTPLSILYNFVKAKPDLKRYLVTVRVSLLSVTLDRALWRQRMRWACVDTRATPVRWERAAHPLDYFGDFRACLNKPGECGLGPCCLCGSHLVPSPTSVYTLLRLVLSPF